MGAASSARAGRALACASSTGRTSPAADFQWQQPARAELSFHCCDLAQRRFVDERARRELLALRPRLRLAREPNVSCTNPGFHRCNMQPRASFVAMW
jgi:hypothetical protein